MLTLAFLWRRCYELNFTKIWLEKPFFEEWSWLKFTSLGFALGATLKLYSSLRKGLKIKVRKFWGSYICRSSGGELVRDLVDPILNRLMQQSEKKWKVLDIGQEKIKLMDYAWHSYLRGNVPQTEKDKRPIHKKGMTPLKLFYTSFYKISKVYVSENITKEHLS